MGQRGRKDCPGCGASVPSRKKECECGHEFIKKGEKPQNSPKKIKPRGIKECVKCGTLQGVRTKICKNKKCGHAFSFINAFLRKKKKPEFDVDWKSLEKGNKIRCLAGHGPYYIGEDGERIKMGESGKFTVMGVNSQGIEATNKSGHAFILMVDRGVSKETDIIRDPHKIRLIQ